MPEFICIQCVAHINQANLFKIKCEQSDLYLKNRIIELRQQLVDINEDVIEQNNITDTILYTDHPQIICKLSIHY